MDDRMAIAAQQLAALVVGGAIAGWNQSHDEMTDEAIRLADLLLTKLRSSVSDTDSSNWTPLFVTRPNPGDRCWVVGWDSSTNSVESVQVATWSLGRGYVGWVDENGQPITFSLRVTVYWTPLDRFAHPSKALFDFSRLVGNWLTIAIQSHLPIERELGD